jgi:hypothetical protein
MDTRFINKQGRGAGGIVDGRMYGRLGTVTSLNDILQLLGMNQRTATVRLDWRGQTGRIYFREGVLLHATAGSAEGDRALVKLMRWEGADFVVEDGIEGKPPESISKRVDAAMLDVMTRLDEGWVPEMTPFPLLDRVTTSPSILEHKVRLAARKPPVPRRAARSKKRLLASIAAAALVLLSVGIALAYRSTELGDLPTIGSAPRRELPKPADPGIASDVLRAAIDGRRNDGIVVLAAHGVSFSPIAESHRADAEPPEAFVQLASAAIAVEAPPAPQSGKLLVIAEPWAVVAVDGVEKGETPLTEMSLPAGSHEIVLSNPNVVGVIRDRIQVPGGQTIQRKYSFRDSGSLRILVRPWADVHVDGRYAGQTPLGALRVPPGTHTILLRHPELGEKTAIVEVFRDRESLLEVEM